ncbi:MAG: nucleotide pyrophosphohydrolase [Bdellovibrionales bacterium]
MSHTKKIEYLRDFAALRDWDQFHTPKNLAAALSVEASELLEIFQWLTTEESFLKSDTINRSRAKEELADVYIYLLRISDRLDIDLEDAFWSKVEKNAEKYPVELSKSNATKYNQRTKDN